MRFPPHLRVISGLFVSGVALFMLFFVVGISSSTAAEEPSPTPTSSTVSDTNPTTPISPSNTSSLVTQVALLLVSAGGVLASIPPIVRAFRKGGDEDDKDQTRVIIAMAKVLAAEERKKEQEHEHEQEDRRIKDVGNSHGPDRRSS